MQHENEKLNPSTKLPIIIIISLLSLNPEALIIGSILRYLLFISTRRYETGGYIPMRSGRQMAYRQGTDNSEKAGYRM